MLLLQCTFRCRVTLLYGWSWWFLMSQTDLLVEHHVRPLDSLTHFIRLLQQFITNHGASSWKEFESAHSVSIFNEFHSMIRTSFTMHWGDIRPYQYVWSPVYSSTPSRVRLLCPLPTSFFCLPHLTTAPRRTEITGQLAPSLVFLFDPLGCLPLHRSVGDVRDWC